MVNHYFWTQKTPPTQPGKGRAWLGFFSSDDRSPLPATNIYLLSFIAWLKGELELGRRKVGIISFPELTPYCSPNALNVYRYSPTGVNFPGGVTKSLSTSVIRSIHGGRRTAGNTIFCYYRGVGFGEVLVIYRRNFVIVQLASFSFALTR